MQMQDMYMQQIHKLTSAWKRAGNVHLEYDGNAMQAAGASQWLANFAGNGAAGISLRQPSVSHCCTIFCMQSMGGK